MDEKNNNLVAKHARKYNKSAVHKDRKKAMKKGDRKHKGRYEEVENVDEVATTVAISNLLKKTANRKKYGKAISDIKSGKYKVGKAAQVYQLDPKTLQSMMEKLSPSDGAGAYVKDFRKSDAPQFKGKSDKKKQQMAIAAYLDAKDDAKKESMEEWACNQTERTRRVKGGDKRKKYMKEKQVEEEKKGLWDRIHAKRKRGEKPAKPGDEDYPKTLDVGEGLKQARKNVGSDSCWDGYKATGTKMKNGKEVPDCKKEGKFDVKKNMVRSNDATKFVTQTGKALDQNHKDTMAALKDLKKRKAMREQLVNELSKRDLERMADRKQKNLVKRGKAKAEPKVSVGRTQNPGQGKTEDDDSLIMQLRKAQDLKGNHEIQFKGGKTKLPKQMIDKLLNTYNKLSKPQDKKRFVTLVTHELRKKEKIATAKPKSASDKAMDKFKNKKGIRPPRGKGSGPSDKELRDIERGK